MRAGHDSVVLAAHDVKPAWGIPQGFDRDPGYDPTWLRYDEVDIYGEPLG